MRSIVLISITRLMMPLLLMVSIFLLLRGHDAPGGGFIGGLMASAAFCLYGLAFGFQRIKSVLHTDPRVVLGVGLLTSLCSGFLAYVIGKPFLTAIWLDEIFSGMINIHVGTPLFFDIGVYLVVVGMVTGIVIAHAED